MSHLATVVTALISLALIGASMAFIVQAPPHATLGTWSELLVPTAITLALCTITFAGWLFAAWAMWRRQLKMASQLAGVMAVVASILVWKCADAANVIFDESDAELHETALIETRTRKSRLYLVLRSWRDEDATLMVDSSDLGSGYGLSPGEPAYLTIRRGAFGRPYATDLVPRSRTPR